MHFSSLHNGHFYSYLHYAHLLEQYLTFIALFVDITLPYRKLLSKLISIHPHPLEFYESLEFVHIDKNYGAPRQASCILQAQYSELVAVKSPKLCIVYKRPSKVF